MLRVALALFAVLASCSVARAESVFRIGLVAPMSGPQGVVGREAVDGFTVALDELGKKLGGVPVEFIVADDEGKPDIGRQATFKLLEQDRADLIMAGGFSNVLLAMAEPVFASRHILLSVNPGSSLFAGKGCNPLFFNVSFQNDTLPEAAGKYISDLGTQNAFFLAPNYQGGKDTLEGFRRYFKGGKLNSLLTQLTQFDFAAELAQIRDAQPQAVFYFFAGDQGVAFAKQWAQSGIKGPRLVTQLSLDQTLMPAIGDAALGIYVSSVWSELLPNAANTRFVADFRRAYHRTPATYAATAYDGARLLDAVLTATGGKFSDADALRKAIETTHFDSVRGNFRFNRNHFPVQDIFMTEIGKVPGGGYEFVPRQTVFINHEDAYVGQCPMK